MSVEKLLSYESAHGVFLKSKMHTAPRPQFHSFQRHPSMAKQPCKEFLNRLISTHRREKPPLEAFDVHGHLCGRNVSGDGWKSIERSFEWINSISTSKRHVHQSSMAMQSSAKLQNETLFHPLGRMRRIWTYTKSYKHAFSGTFAGCCCALTTNLNIRTQLRK